MPRQELYTRQETLGLSLPASLTIVGCGGIGSWAAIFAAMSGIPQLVLFDPDVLEESNRNRLPLCQGSVGRPKVEVVADFIRPIRPECLVVGIAARMDEMLFSVQRQLGMYYLMDCTDSPKTQILLYKLCKDNNVGYIRAGYDGTRIMVTSVVSGWIKQDAEEENYTINPSWVVPASTVAALAIHKLCLCHDQEVGLDLSEIGIPVVQKQRRLTARCTQRAGG